MIGLDTKIVIRYLVQDDPEQSAVACRIFEKELSAHNKGHICPIVLCEVVWVLLRSYKQKKEKILTIIRTLLLASNIEIQHSDSAWRALKDYEKGSADFSDYLIAHLNKDCGATYTLTFDRAAAKNRLLKLAQ